MGDMTVKGAGAVPSQVASQASGTLPGATTSWTPQRGDTFGSAWAQAGGSKETAYLARLAFLKLNGFDQKEFDFWRDIRPGHSYVMPSAADVEANFDGWNAFVGEVPKDSPSFRAVDKDIREHPSELGKKAPSTPVGHEELARAIGARTAGVKVGGAPTTPAPAPADQQQPVPGTTPAPGQVQGADGAQAIKDAEDVRKPGFLNKVAEVLELFLRWTSPVFNLLMLYVRVIRVAFTWLKNLVAKTSIGQSLGLKETKIDWGAEFKRGLADFAGVIFPPAGAIAHAGINYWFDDEPAEQWGGLNYYVPGQADKQYAFKKELDWAFGKLKAGKDAVVDTATRTGQAIKGGFNGAVEGAKEGYRSEDVDVDGFGADVEPQEVPI